MVSYKQLIARHGMIKQIFNCYIKKVFRRLICLYASACKQKKRCLWNLSILLIHDFMNLKCLYLEGGYISELYQDKNVYL